MDTLRKMVTVEVNHFTMFDLAEDVAQVPTQLSSYWEKNPIRYSEGGTDFVMKIPEAGKAILRIFDLSGELVYEVLNRKYGEAGEYRIGWRGQNVSERSAGAGIYVYSFVFIPDAVGKDKTIVRKPIGVLQ